MKLNRNREISGVSIILVISVLATLMVIVGIAVELSVTINRHVKRSANMQNAVAVADGVVDMMFGQWREICRATPTTPLATSAFSAIPLPTSTQLPNLQGATGTLAVRGTSGFLNGTSNDELDKTKTVSNYKVVAVDPLLNDLASTSTHPNPGIGQQVSTASYNYVAAVDVTLPSLGAGGNVVTKVRRVFQKQQMSPWNFAIFYVDPLEIHPGPAFTVTGWIHTNSDLYTGHNTLTFANKVTYGHDWTIGFMPGDSTHPETPASPNYPSNLPPALDVAKQPFGLDSTQLFSTTDTNPNNDSYHELIEQAAAGYTDPLTGMRYYDQAAIKILIDASNNITVKKANGTTVTSASSGNDKKLWTAITGALTTNQSIQDNREAASVRLVTLNVGSIVTSLTNASASSNHIDSANWNGIIYISDTSGTSTTHRGVRLTNGDVLPTNGLTVASANPVYIQGDFNTGSASPPSNSGDPTQPTSLGYTKQPSSIITDAVNFLSNAWSDSNSSAGLGSRIASNTTVNTAIIAGIVQTGGGYYSGGAENFPRFLEDWSNKTMTYYGSMVELFQSKQSVGRWGSANVYGPPLRQWYFDTGFYTNSPPGSLMLYSYVKGRWSLAP